MGYIETDWSWDYVGMTVYPLDEDGQRTGAEYYLPEMGLYKVSNSNRQNDILVPTLKHTTVEVPGGDGTYWFGSQYTQKPITVKFAYDNLTEQNLYTLRWLFDGKKHLHVIFDEYPYKYYDMVVSAAPQFDYVPFTEDRLIGGIETPRRIFKGEGSVQLVSYLPYAIGVEGIKKWGDFNPAPPNLEELKGTVNYYTGSYQIDTYGTIVGNQGTGFIVWNAGELPTDYKLHVDKDTLNAISSISIKTFFSHETLAVFEKTTTSTITEDLTFDSKLHLIYNNEGKIRNSLFASTEAFITIPPETEIMPEIIIFVFNGTNLPQSGPTITYSYKFY